MTDREVIENIIEAWEKLRGGRQVGVRDVEAWLAKTMAPAIDNARRHTGRLRPDGSKP